MTKVEIIKKAVAETKTILVHDTPETLAKRWTKDRCERFAQGLYEWYEIRTKR